MDYEKLKLDKQLCFRLYAASRLITQAYRPYLDKLGVTYPQYLVLMVLWETDELPVNDIAKRLALETNTVTPLIQRMEREGIVNRTKGKVDTRQTIVSLTAHGKELRDRWVFPTACSKFSVETVCTNRPSLKFSLCSTSSSTASRSEKKTIEAFRLRHRTTRCRSPHEGSLRDTLLVPRSVFVMRLRAMGVRNATHR